MQKTTTYILHGLVFVLGLAAAVVVSVVIQSASLKEVYAQGVSGLSGYAWSDTVGWVSMRGGSGSTAYGVNVDSNGFLSGYAWSDTIGWIKFGGLSSFPTGSGTSAADARVSGSSIIGWARACAGTSAGDCSSMTSRTDGWDGWIALSGTGYGPAISGTSVSGYAWGSDVVGWLSFAQVTYAPSVTPPAVTTYAQTGLGFATVTLEGGANPNGNSTTGWFRYSTSNPGTCTDSFGTRAPSSGGYALGSGSSLVGFDHDLTGLNDSTTYYYCALASNGGGTAVGTVRFFTTDATPECQDGIDNDADTLTDMADSGCTSDTDAAELNNPTLNSVTSSSVRVRSGQDMTITWSGTELPSTCQLSSTPAVNDPDGGNDTPRTVSSTPTGNSAGVLVGPITQSTVITLTCGSSAVSQKTVTIVPNVEEI